MCTFLFDTKIAKDERSAKAKSLLLCSGNAESPPIL